MANLELIRKRFEDARKIYGLSDEITTPSGTKVQGRYILVESGCVTPSHDPTNGFAKCLGFPTDANGQTVNDRDYERDNDAQSITRQIAATYDSRALQTPVVISRDGIVLSGNGRTMAGMLAARDNTDAAYIAYLKSYSEKYGIKAEGTNTFAHPRLVFVVCNEFPYNAETFAMFNAQDIKSQSKTEQAVKLGKLVGEETFNRIIRSINSFDTIGDFYNNAGAATEAVNELRNAGIVSQMQYPEMFDGDTISQAARELLENVLIGKAFASDPDAVRKITAFKGVRRNIITALSEISTNIALERGYSLETEMSQAIALMYQARSNGRKQHGDTVSDFARQTTCFGDDGETVADFRNAAAMALADLINHSQVQRLKKFYVLYNHNAAEPASGQTDMFSGGGVMSKDDILRDVLCSLTESSAKELKVQLSEANAQRKSEAANQIVSSGGTVFAQLNERRRKNNVLCGLNLASGDVIAVWLKSVKGCWAYICTLGDNTYKVPLASLASVEGEHATLPQWFKAGTTLSDGKRITSIDGSFCTLSDGNRYQHIIVLLYCKPAANAA